MKYTLRAALAASIVAISAAGMANASQVTFDMFDSTNANQLHPEVTISEVAGGFQVSALLLSPEFGDLEAIFVDLGSGWSDPDFNNLVFRSDDPDVDPGADYSYEFSEAGINAKTYGGGVCGGNILSGGLNLPLFEGVACHRSTGPNQPNDGVNPYLLTILDPDSVLSLSSFEGVALRYKSASNTEGSDKLFSSTPMSPVPLPASALLLLGGVGGLGALRAARRKAA